MLKHDKNPVFPTEPELQYLDDGAGMNDEEERGRNVVVKEVRKMTSSSFLRETVAQDVCFLLPAGNKRGRLSKHIDLVAQTTSSSQTDATSHSFTYVSSLLAMSASNLSRPLRVGLVGGGVVGGGAYEILMGRLGGSSGKPTPPLLRPCVVTKLCVKDATKKRDFVIDTSITEVVTDVQSILQDDDIDVVVEVMGGTGIARTVVEEALKNKKAVVTANKALLAEYLDEMHQLALENNATLAFEAAVCGGIPIIQTLHSCYSGDIITEVMGICNGTTNYMLGKMEHGADYDEVLNEAQNLGFAEADPTADVEGHDVRAKICLLAKLAFGTTVKVEDVPCRGITKVTPVDFEYAKLLGCTIKLVGTARRLPLHGKSSWLLSNSFLFRKDVLICMFSFPNFHHPGQYDGPLSVFVAPAVVPNTHLLASARSNGNAVAVSSSNMGTCSYTGPGAGRFPTANSVVADIVRVANGQAMINPFPIQTQLELDPDYTSPHYIRIPFQDALGIIRKVGELAEEHGISIHSILQNPIVDKMEADFCITTDDASLSQVDAFCEAVASESFCRSPPLAMPLLMEL
jgi:homoserine dehydrogenase